MADTRDPAIWDNLEFHKVANVDQRATPLTASIEEMRIAAQANSVPGKMRALLDAQSAKNMALVEQLVSSGLNPASKIHLHQNAHGTVNMFLTGPTGAVSNLPVFNDAGFATLGGSTVIPTQRVIGNVLQEPHEIVGIKLGRAQLAETGVRGVRAAVEDWRKVHTLHMRGRLGSGASPFYLRNRIRIQADNPLLVDEAGNLLGPQIAQARKELITLGRTRTADGTALHQADARLGSLIEKLTAVGAQHGLHITGISQPGLVRGGKLDKVTGDRVGGYFTFSGLSPNSLVNDPYWDYRKGEHQHVQKMAIMNGDWMRFQSPHLVHSQYHEAMKSVGIVERTRRRLPVGAQFSTEAPIILCALGIRSGSPVGRAISDRIGDSAAYVTSDYMRSIARMSPDIAQYREAVMDHFVGDSRVAGSNLVVHDLLHPYTKPGSALDRPLHYRDFIEHAREKYIHTRMGEVAGNRLTTDDEYLIPELRKQLGAEFDSNKELRNRASIIGWSADDQTLKSKAIRIRPGEVISRMDVGPVRSRVYLQNLKARPTDVSGVRTILGSTRASLVDTRINHILNEKFSVDAIMAEGNLGARLEQYRMSTAVSRIGMSTMTLEQKKQAQSVMANMLGGSIFEFEGQSGAQVGVRWGKVPEGKTPLEVIRAAERQIGEKMFPGLSGTELQEAIEKRKMFRVPYQRQMLSLRELMDPATKRIGLATAEKLGQQLGLSKDEIRALRRDGRLTMLHTGAGLRTSQPGYTQGAAGSRMTFRRLQAMEEIMRPYLGPNAMDADSKAVKSLWRRLSTPSGARGQAMYQAAFQLSAQNAGDVTKHVGRDHLSSLANYQQEFGGIDFSVPKGGLKPWDAQNNPLFFDQKGMPTKRARWVELPQEIVIQTQDKALRTKHIPVPSGAFLGFRKGRTMYADRKLGLIESTAKLHAALSAGDMDSIRVAAGEVVDKMGTSFKRYSKKGFKPRIRAGGQGALLPMGSLKPGEVGVTMKRLIEMGATDKEIELVKKGDLPAMFLTDPAFSQSHFSAVNLRLVEAPHGQEGMSVLYTNAKDLLTRQRDNDADVGKIIFGSNISKAMRVLLKSQKIEGRADALAKTGSQAVKVTARDIGYSMLYGTEELAGFATTDAERASMAYARSRPQAMTPAAHTITDKASKLISNISSGATLQDIGLTGATAGEAKAFARMQELMQGESAEKLYHISKTSEAFIYTALKKAQKGSAGDKFLEDYLKLAGGTRPNVGTKAWEKGVDALEQSAVAMMADTPLERELAPAMRRQVVEAMALTAPLMAAGARPTQEAITRRSGLPKGGTWEGLSRALRSVFKNRAADIGPSPVLTEGLGDASQAVQNAAADAAANMKSMPNKSAYSLTRMLKGASERIGKMWKENKTFRWMSMIGAGVALASTMMEGDNEPNPPMATPDGPGLPRDANVALPGMGQTAPDFNMFTPASAPVQRPMGVRTHFRVDAEGPGGVDLAGIADASYGSPWNPVVNSGEIQDRSSGQKYRDQMEREIRSQIRSSF
jgi:hypothetical protein